MIDNGCKPPTVTETWRTAARLMLDRDGRDFAKSTNLLDWATRDEFWMANVQSMGKFRAQYDTLRLRAIAEHERKLREAKPEPKMSTGDARFLRQVAEHEAMFNPDGSFRDSPATSNGPGPRQLPSSRPSLGVHA